MEVPVIVTEHDVVSEGELESKNVYEGPPLKKPRSSKLEDRLFNILSCNVSDCDPTEIKMMLHCFWMICYQEHNTAEVLGSSWLCDLHTFLFQAATLWVV